MESPHRIAVCRRLHAKPNMDGGAGDKKCASRGWEHRGDRGDFQAGLTGRLGRGGMVSRGFAALHPGLLSYPPYGGSMREGDAGVSMREVRGRRFEVGGSRWEGRCERFHVRGPMQEVRCGWFDRACPGRTANIGHLAGTPSREFGLAQHRFHTALGDNGSCDAYNCAVS